MSWISDIEHTFNFKCEDKACGYTTKIKSKEDSEKLRRDPPKCFKCGGVTSYGGFEPVKIGQTHNVEYEQNGRKAIRTRGKNGEIQHVSKTKMHYMKTGRIENQYTKAYQEKMQKEAAEAERKAKAMEASQAERRKHQDQVIKEQIKNMPDGEYVSDGINFTPLHKQK
jgi:hypothetical protein